MRNESKLSLNTGNSLSIECLLGCCVTVLPIMKSSIPISSTDENISCICVGCITQTTPTWLRNCTQNLHQSWNQGDELYAITELGEHRCVTVLWVKMRKQSIGLCAVALICVGQHLESILLQVAEDGITSAAKYCKLNRHFHHGLTHYVIVLPCIYGPAGRCHSMSSLHISCASWRLWTCLSSLTHKK